MLPRIQPRDPYHITLAGDQLPGRHQHRGAVGQRIHRSHIPVSQRDAEAGLGGVEGGARS